MNVAEKVLQLKQDFDDVYEAGKQAGGGLDWDMLTDFGNRNVFTYTFYGARLMDSNGKILFAPNYSMKPTSAACMFEGTKGSIDLQEQFEKAGKELNFSDCTTLNRVFYNSEIVRIGIISAIKSANLTGLCGNSKKLRIIDRIEFSKDINYTFTNAFVGCEALTDVTAYGELATSGLDLSACPLTRASKLSFLEILVPTSDTKTIKFGAGEALTNEDVAIGTQKGWSVTV